MSTFLLWRAMVRFWHMSMPDRPRLLILGGTRDAATLAGQVVLRWGSALDVMTSLAGRTMAPAEIPGQVRTGGFGGPDAMADYLAVEGITAVIDATHPFAAKISGNAERACVRANVPRLLVDRPHWEQVEGDQWHFASSYVQAAEMLPRLGHRVFLTTGHSGLDAFASFQDAWFLVRLVDAPSGTLPLANYETIAARGPFTQADERALIERHEIDVIVCKASGGDMTRAKLDVARAMGLPVLMITRPDPPDGPRVNSIDGAMAWLEDMLT